MATKVTIQREQDLKTRIKELDEKIISLIESKENIENLLGSAEKEVERLTSELSGRVRIEIDAEAKARESAKHATKAQMDYVKAKADIERLEKELARLKLQFDEAVSAKKNAEKRAEELKKEIDRSKKGQTGFGDTIEMLFSETEEARVANDELRELDIQSRDLTNSISELEKLVHERSMEKHEQEMQAGWIKENLRTEYGIIIDEIEIEEKLTGEEERKAQIKLDRLKTRVADFGGINPEAETQYEEEKKRLDFLIAQHKDLTEAKEELKKVIRKLNNTARQEFLQTFEETRRHFREIFTELFEGGEADLNLTEGEDVLEADIEISARPRGKRFLSINQLSAGEKALCALALLFGLYKVKPSPFCMLDEVDAPLDEANISRFLKLLKRFSIDTQFILITHNKRTMEAADYLYGITMEEEGVSKALSLRKSDLKLDFGTAEPR